MIIKNKIPSITIGIPTYHGGDNLEIVLNSIYNQTFYKYITKVIVIVDGNRLSEKIKVRLKNKKLQIIEMKLRRGQANRINDIIKKAKSDILILTNDDVILDRKAVASIIRAFTSIKPDLICTKAVPLMGNSLLEHILFLGYKLKYNLLENIPSYNSYLACNGRLLGLSRNLYKKLVIPTNLINNDAYIYLFTKENNFSFIFLNKTLCYFRNPSKLFEHLNQTTKFQSSAFENKQYFSEETINSSYHIPYFTQMSSYMIEFFTKPFLVTAYLGILVFSRVYGQIIKMSTIDDMIKKGFWKTDVTTKQLA